MGNKKTEKRKLQRARARAGRDASASAGFTDLSDYKIHIVMPDYAKRFKRYGEVLEVIVKRRLTDHVEIHYPVPLVENGVLYGIPMHPLVKAEKKQRKYGKKMLKRMTKPMLKQFETVLKDDVWLKPYMDILELQLSNPYMFLLYEV